MQRLEPTHRPFLALTMFPYSDPSSVSVLLHSSGQTQAKERKIVHIVFVALHFDSLLQFRQPLTQIFLESMRAVSYLVVFIGRHAIN